MIASFSALGVDLPYIALIVLHSFVASIVWSNISTNCLHFCPFMFVRYSGDLLLSTHSLDPCLWGESDHPAFGPPASLSLSMVKSSITPVGSVHKSRGDTVVRMWVQLKRWCVSCVWVLQRGHSSYGCDLASTLCKYEFRKIHFVSSELGNGATSEAVKCLFRAAIVWWRCAQYFIIASCG